MRDDVPAAAHALARDLDALRRMPRPTTRVDLGTVLWDGRPVIRDERDDGDGDSPVREPRRPRPGPLAPAAAAMALPVERPLVSA